MKSIFLIPLLIVSFYSNAAEIFNKINVVIVGGGLSSSGSITTHNNRAVANFNGKVYKFFFRQLNSGKYVVEVSSSKPLKEEKRMDFKDGHLYIPAGTSLNEEIRMAVISKEANTALVFDNEEKVIVRPE